jgi:hypothetical protein
MIKIYEAPGAPWMYIWCCLAYNKAIYDATLGIGELLFWEVNTSCLGRVPELDMISGPLPSGDPGVCV